MTTDFATPVFGIKAKLTHRARLDVAAGILPRPFLESRQSDIRTIVRRVGILPRPFLESRQSTSRKTFLPRRRQSYLGGRRRFCHARFWNQGKARLSKPLLMWRFCHARFWNQGKARSPRRSSTPQFCHARFWNQGKAAAFQRCCHFHFATPVFGIKAKLDEPGVFPAQHFATPRFWNQGKA